MRFSPLVTTLFVFLLLVILSASTLGQQSSPSPSLTPERVSLTEFPASVMNAELKSARGPSFKLSDYSGKVLVVNLWATWLGPSRLEIPELVKLQKRLWSQGVRVVGLSTEKPEESVEAVHEFARNYQIQYKIGWATTEVSVALLQGRDALPQTYVISGSGRIVRRFIGFNPQESPDQLKEAIEEALRQSAVPKVPSTQ